MAALLGGDLDGSTGARHIAEALFQREVGERNGSEGEPAVAPEADGIDLKVEGGGRSGSYWAISGGENDAGAEGKLLGEGMATQQRLQARGARQETARPRAVLDLAWRQLTILENG